jgi:putative membrane protein
MDLRDYLAEERTFLAWIRTGLAMMGFGFAVARFGGGSSAHSPWLSVWCGTALIAAGVAVNLSSARRYSQLPSRDAAVLAVFLALVGIAMAIYVTLPDAVSVL